MSKSPRLLEALLAFALSAMVYLAVGRHPGTADTLPTALLPVLIVKDGTLRFEAYLPAIEAEVGDAYFPDNRPNRPAVATA